MLRSARPAQADHTSEDDLLRRLALGDQAALEALHRRCAPALVTLATHIVGERWEAEEVVQEAFFEAWRKASRFDVARGSAQGWLQVIVRSRALDRLRANHARARAATAAFVEEQSLAQDSPDLIADAELAEMSTRVRAALGGLPPEQRRLLELSHLEGLSHSHIAQLTGLPLGTVKTRLRAAKQRLISLL